MPSCSGQVIWQVWYAIDSAFYIYLLFCDIVIIYVNNEKLSLRIFLTLNAYAFSTLCFFMDDLVAVIPDGCRVVFILYQIVGLSFFTSIMRFWFFRVDFFTLTYFKKRGFGPQTGRIIQLNTLFLAALSFVVVVSQVEYVGHCKYELGRDWTIILPLVVLLNEFVLFLRFCFLLVYIISYVPINESRQQLSDFLCFSTQYVGTGFLALLCDVSFSVLLALQIIQGNTAIIVVWHLCTINYLMITLCYPVSSMNIKLLLQQNKDVEHYNRCEMMQYTCPEPLETREVTIDGVEYICDTENPFAASDSGSCSSGSPFALE